MNAFLCDQKLAPLFEGDTIGQPNRTRAYFTVAEIARDIVTGAGPSVIAAIAPCGVSPSDGSPTYTVMDAAMVAKRACDVAECLMAEIVTRGWFIERPMPSMDDQKDMPAPDTCKYPLTNLGQYEETGHAPDVEAGRTDAPEVGVCRRALTEQFPPRVIVEVPRGEV